MVQAGDKSNVKSKNHEAYRAIKEMVLERHLFPGQKLVYRDLEQRLGMSKTPIINGLMMLENEHLVVSEKNRGYHIRYVNRREAEYIYDLREKLEDIAIEYAVANHDKRDLALLKRKLVAYRKYRNDTLNQKRLALDVDFHVQIAGMGKNPFFVQMVRQYYERVHFMFKAVFLTPSPDRFDCFKDEHDRLYGAIKSRDLEEARRIGREHIRGARELLIKLIPE